MGEPTGFLKWGRTTPKRRPIPVRVADWREVYEPFDQGKLHEQAGVAWTAAFRFATTVVHWAT